jgi:uncharacterized circularly permuted ATP-grasp superfamily protein
MTVHYTNNKFYLEVNNVRYEIQNHELLIGTEAFRSDVDSYFNEGDTFPLPSGVGYTLKEDTGCDVWCKVITCRYSGCLHEMEVAILHLIEQDEDKRLADKVKERIAKSEVVAMYRRVEGEKGDNYNQAIDDALEILYCYLPDQTTVTKEIIDEVKKLKV